MLLVLISTLLYFSLYLVLRKSNRNAARLTLASATFLLLTLLMLITGLEIFVKIQYATVLFLIVYGAYVVSYLGTGDELFSKGLFFSYLGIWLGALCILSKESVSAEAGMLFFSRSVSQNLWIYTLYAFFYPGVVVAFMMMAVALDNLDTKTGIRMLSVAILSGTLGLSLYFAAREPVYGAISLLINDVWAVMFLAWEVWE